MTRMNAAYDEIIAASDDERRDLFVGTARRLGTTVQNVEKDFWVCWILDALFNGLPAGEARLLFKGGTSLSKAYGLIDRFSEDVDITVFRDDLGPRSSRKEGDASQVRRSSDGGRERLTVGICSLTPRWRSHCPGRVRQRTSSVASTRCGVCAPTLS
jgi:hypothetical protein